MEIKEFNDVPEKLKKHVNVLDYSKVEGRGELFPKPNVEDNEERMYNNF
jgi:hypothetical protein